MATRVWTGAADGVLFVKHFEFTGKASEGSYAEATISKKVVSARVPFQDIETADTAAEQTEGQGLIETDDDRDDAAMLYLVQALAANINASSFLEFSEITATSSVLKNGTPVLIISANEPGIPIEITVTATHPDIDTKTTAVPTAGVNQIDQFYFDDTATGGTYTIEADFGSGLETSNPITFGAAASVVEAAMVAGMASVAANDVAVTGDGTSGDPFVLTYKNNLALTTITDFDVDVSNLAFGGVVTLTNTRAGTAGNNDAVIMLTLSSTYADNRVMYFRDLGTGAQQGSTFTPVLADTVASLQTKINTAIGSGNCVVSGYRDGTESVFVLVMDGTLAGRNIDIISTTGVMNGTDAYSSMIQTGGTEDWQAEIISFEIDATGGTYDITYGSETRTIIWNSSDLAVDLLDAIETEEGFSDGQVAVYNGGGGGTFNNEFIVVRIRRDLASGSFNAGAVTFDDTNLTGGGSTISNDAVVLEGTVSATNALWECYTNGSGGSFDLTYDENEADGLLYNLSDSGLESALEAAWGSGNVQVNSGSGTVVDPWEIELIGSYAGDSGTGNITSDASALLSDTVDYSATTTTEGQPASGEVWTVTLTGATGGTFKLAYEDDWTGDIAYNASAATVETALEAVMGASNVSVSGSAGGPYTITATGDLATGDLWQLEDDGDNLTGTGAITITNSYTQNATGPWHWDDDANWENVADGSEGVPTTGDDVLFIWGDAEHCPKYGLDQNAVALNSLKVFAGFEDDAQIGLPRRNEAGYHEYRDRELRIDMQGDAIIEVGARVGAGSPLIAINNGSTKALIDIYRTSSPVEGEPAAFQWRSTHADSTLQLISGSAGAGVYPGHTAVLDVVTQREGFFYGTDELSITDSFEASAGERSLDGVTFAGLLTIMEL